MSSMMDVDQPETTPPVMEISSPTSSGGGSSDEVHSQQQHQTQQSRGKRLSANKPGLTLNLSAPPARFGFGGATPPMTPSYQMATTPNAPPPVANVLSDQNRQNQNRLHAHWATNSQDWNLDSPALAGAHPTYSPWEGPPSFTSSSSSSSSLCSYQTPSTPTTAAPNGRRSTSPVAHTHASMGGGVNHPGDSGKGTHTHGGGNHSSSSHWRRGHASRASRELTEMTADAMAATTPTNPYFGQQSPFGLQSAGFSLHRPGSTGTVRGQ